MPLLSTYARALALSTLLIIPSTAAQTCYYPDGSESNHVACRSSGSEASCCDASQVCMDNGLCFGDGIMSRGSCTDKDWNSQECSQFCYEGMYQRFSNWKRTTLMMIISITEYQHPRHSMHKRRRIKRIHVRPKRNKLQEKLRTIHITLRQHHSTN